MNSTITYPLNMIIFIISVIVYISLILLITGRKGRLTPLSVRQGLDNMSSGICFADDTDKIILINRVMGNLISELTGRYPYNVNELYTSINNSKSSLHDNLYRFPDNRIWSITSIPLSDPALKGYTQISAKDVTDIINANESLRLENDALKETNEKLNEMYVRLSDRIRDEETLKLKARIHDDIGAGLLALSSLMESGSDEDIEHELMLLKDAVSYFGVRPETLDHDMIINLKKEASRLGITLKISGALPPDETIDTLDDPPSYEAGQSVSSSSSYVTIRKITEQAIRECMTNCVIHAGGNEVYVSIRYLDTDIDTDRSDSDKTPFSYIESEQKRVVITITNNGTAPETPVTEGSGLSSLRQSVEAVGGTMDIESKPEFKLILMLLL